MRKTEISVFQDVAQPAPIRDDPSTLSLVQLVCFSISCPRHTLHPRKEKAKEKGKKKM